MKIIKLLPVVLLGSALFGCTYEVYDDPYWSPPPPGPGTCCDDLGCFACGYYDQNRHWHRHHRGGRYVPPGGIPAPPANQPLKPNGPNAGSNGSPGWTP